MNWFVFSGGFVVFIVIGVLALFGSEKIHRKLNAVMNPVACFVVSLVFMLFNLLMLFADIAINLVSQGKYAWIGVIAGALWIPLSWFFIGKITRYMDEKNEINKDVKRLLFIASIILIMIMSCVWAYTEKNLVYIQFVGLVIALFVGTFFPIEDYYNDGDIIPVTKRFNVTFSFKGVRLSHIIAIAVASVAFLAFSLFENIKNDFEMVLPSLSLGLCAGVIVIIVVGHITGKVKAKGKNEDNDKKIEEGKNG